MSIYRSRTAASPRGSVHSLLLAAALVAPRLAAAQVGVAPPPPPPPSSLPMAGPMTFAEPGRFQIRNVRIGGQPVGPTAAVSLPSGGRVSVAVDLNHACPSCGASVNQIIVGLAGEARAQACLYSGPSSTYGWRTATFELNIPSQPGRYDVRARYAQAWNCGAALDWWRVDRPQGPEPAATIAVILVGPPPAQPPPPPPSGARAPREIRAEIEGRLAWIDEVGAQLAQARGPGALAALRPEELGLQLRAQVEVLRQLQRELQAAHRSRDDRDEGWGGGRMPPPPPPPRLVGMEAGAYQALIGRLQAESFERYRIDRLRDTLGAGARLTITQALGVLEEFDFANYKTQAAVMVCPVIDEAGALAPIAAALPYEPNRRELRSRTAGRCGL